MIDLLTITFAVAAFIEILTVISIFYFKNILHVALSLTAAFFFNSILFLVLNQPILAVLQLFIMVGGISTLLFVGVASAEFSKFTFTRIAVLFAMWLVLAVIMIYPTLKLTIQSHQQNIFSTDNILLSFGSDLGIFYVMLLTIFGVAISSILLLKSIGAPK